MTALRVGITRIGRAIDNPHRVWRAIDRKARQPTLDWPPLEVVWWSPRVLSFGVVEKLVGGTRIRVTSPAKTVADCQIGAGVAVQAIRDYRRSRDELFEGRPSLSGVANASNLLGGDDVSTSRLPMLDPDYLVPGFPGGS